MKKLCSLILAICMVVFIFTSCNSGNNNENTENVNNNTVEESVAVDNTTSAVVKDDVPEMDLGGYNFRILSSGEPHIWHGILNVEQETGDVVDDSIYRRDRAIEDRFNITISEAYDYTKIVKSVKSGSNDYDFVTGWCDPMFGYVVSGYGYKFSDYGQYIDLSKPYWDPGITKSLTFGDTILFPEGAIDLTTYDLIHVLLFNKQIIKNFALDDPYSLVRSGNWTFDKFDEIAKSVTKDVDGNGIMDANDMYGLVSMVKYVLPDFWVSAGVQSISRTSGNLPQFTLTSDVQFASVIDKIFAVTYDNNSWYRDTTDLNNYNDVHNTIFMDNRALFFDSTFKMIEDVRGMNTDFGIIPYPKFTAEQDNYYTRTEGCFPFIVPITVPEPEKIGAV
ncbi:MAG: hypothetical protein FWD71_23060, partial [Oscillospiraceae bacterium]|nr:hypothetical protein [Oscillospiraceae bacterium]